MIYRAYGKRFFDIFFSMWAIILLLPLFIVVSTLIKYYDSWPVIFRQRRVGRNGELFIFYKFRSMPINTGDIPSDKIVKFKIGRIGQIIRRTSIDEIPQLFNILRGDMSFVGPRPPIAIQTELIEARRSNGALACRPGLTGLAQINSFDGMSTSQKADLDGVYTRSITFLSDMKIILGTFIYILKPPPKY